jgi:hypothetical protein
LKWAIIVVGVCHFAVIGVGYTCICLSRKDTHRSEIRKRDEMKELKEEME